MLNIIIKFNFSSSSFSLLLYVILYSNFFSEKVIKIHNAKNEHRLPPIYNFL